MPEDTPEISRRRFLRGASLGVAAGVAAAAALPSAASLVAAAPSGSKRPTTAEDTDLSAVGSDVIAHVRDASTGEIAVIVGGSERVYRDPALVARLLAGARRAQSEA
jgi:anaerobic selenocysteine-containing dehydrogenase